MKTLQTVTESSKALDMLPTLISNGDQCLTSDKRARMFVWTPNAEPLLMMRQMAGRKQDFSHTTGCFR